ncbi:MAG: pitrilysin family protein [Patescibacteria group bacterium]|nr:pitrilysin family protein [Patescibacteria group bacterium]
MKAVKHILSNGLRAVLVPRADAVATNVLVLVEAGSKYETSKISGLSHFLEHMCFKGTKQRPKAIDISSELDSMGASYNAFTSQEYTGYYATVQPKMADRALDLIADMYLNPIFPKAEVEKEKGVIVEEINMYEDLPIRQAQDLFMELVYGDQPVGWNIVGTKEIVRSMKRNDFINYRSKHYVASATTVIVAGKFNQTKTLRRIEAVFKNISDDVKQDKLAVVEKQAGPRLMVKTKSSDQTHCVLGFRSYPLGHPEEYPLEVLAAALGGGMSSRLFRRIREQMGAAYYIRAFQDSYTDNGLLNISVGADTKRALEIIKAVVEECAKLRDKALPAAELRRVKDSMIGNLFLSLEGASSIGLFYGMQELLRQKLRSPQQIAKKIEAVTAADVRRVAKQIFAKDKINLAMVGPAVEQKKFARALAL